MKLTLIRIQLRYIFILALAAGIGFVYPVHVIVDHSGLFDHQTQDDHHSGDQGSDDDLCAFCLTLNSMEASEAGNPVSERGEITNYAFKSGVPGKVSISGKSARAPPVIF